MTIPKPDPYGQRTVNSTIWRDEFEWPLARTQWKDFYLGGDLGNGTLTDTPPLDGEQTLDYDPTGDQWIWGQPRWVYRRTLLLQAKNTIVQGRDKSKVGLPIIPR